MAISELNISGAKSLSTNRARTPYGKKKKKISSTYKILDLKNVLQHGRQIYARRKKVRKSYLTKIIRHSFGDSS
jgi:hypothetical protein